MAKAQDTTKIQGVVVDTLSNEPLVGVEVLIKKGRDTLAYTISDFDGNYALSLEKAGVCNIEYKLSGYYPIRISSIRIDENKSTRLDMKLKEDRLHSGLYVPKPQKEGVRDFIIIVPALLLFLIGVTSL